MRDSPTPSADDVGAEIASLWDTWLYRDVRLVRDLDRGSVTIPAGSTAHVIEATLSGIRIKVDAPPVFRSRFGDVPLRYVWLDEIDLEVIPDADA